MGKRTELHSAGTATELQCYLKVHKHENFFGSDIEFLTFLWKVKPNYYFLEIFFSLHQY